MTLNHHQKLTVIDRTLKLFKKKHNCHRLKVKKSLGLLLTQNYMLLFCFIPQNYHWLEKGHISDNSPNLVYLLRYDYFVILGQASQVETPKSSHISANTPTMDRIG